MALSLMIFTSSGKWYPYHSLQRNNHSLTQFAKPQTNQIPDSLKPVSPHSQYRPGTVAWAEVYMGWLYYASSFYTASVRTQPVVSTRRPGFSPLFYPYKVSALLDLVRFVIAKLQAKEPPRVWYKPLHCILPDTHREGIDIFIQLVQKTYGLDDHVVHPIHIKFYFGTRIAVPQP